MTARPPPEANAMLHTATPTSRFARPRRRRGGVLVYSILLMVILLAMVSLGMDYAHVQSVKTEEQRSADITARGMLQMYTSWGNTVVGGYTTVLANLNGIDGKYNGGVATPTVTWGTYDDNSNTFSPNAASRTAVKVTIARTAANNNPVRLIFPLLTGNGRFPIKTSIDVSATAIAYYTTTANATISGKCDPWLAGVPVGSNSVSAGDTAPNESPVMVCQVTPGDTITFTNVSSNNGGVSHDPSLSPDGPNGNTSSSNQIYGHNSDNTAEPPVQNNIGDVKMPIDALLGVFLTDKAPTAVAAPTVVRDYSTQAARDVASTTDLQTQQPFYIGDGKTSGGTVKTFKVPANCTRLFLGVMDGHEWSNNAGSFGVTINHGPTIKLVQ